MDAYRPEEGSCLQLALPLLVLSTSAKGFKLALFETFVNLVRNAGFSEPFVLQFARHWAKTWSPKGFSGGPSHLKIGFEDVEVAARWLRECII